MKVRAHFHALRLLSSARRIRRQKKIPVFCGHVSKIISQDLTNTQPRARRSPLPRFPLEIQKGAGERGGVWEFLQ